MYVPVQRSGNLDEEAEVTLKVIDLSARHDVNYTMEVCDSDVEPVIDVADTSLLDIVQNAEGISEEEMPTESDLGAMLQESGGAQIVDTEGNPIGSVTATAVNENGDAQQEPAEDAGDGNIIGNRIDIWMPTREDCIQFGYRECTIYILGGS